METEYMRAVEGISHSLLARDKHIHYLRRQLHELTEIAEALRQAIDAPLSPFATLAIEAWNDYKAAYPEDNQ